MNIHSDQFLLKIWKLGFIGICVTVTVAAAVLLETAPPIGPWVDLYSVYAFLWVLIGFAVIGLTLLIAYHPLLQPLAVIISLLIGSLVIGISRQWDIPFGVRDPWIHVSLIISRDLSPQVNPYPALHALVAVLETVMGTSPKSVLAGVPILAFTICLIFAAATFGRITNSERVNQLAPVIAIPAGFVGFIARPFTLAVPFIILVYWLIIARLSRQPHTILLLLFGTATLLLHPVVAIICLIILVGVSVIQIVDRLSIGGTTTYFAGIISRPNVARDTAIMSIFTAVYISYFTGVFLLTVYRFAVSPNTGSGGTVQSSAGILAEIIPNIVEFIIRTSYPIGLGILACLGLLIGIRRRRIDKITATSLFATAGITAFFILQNFVPAIRFGVARVVYLIPLVLIPAALRGLEFNRGKFGWVVKIALVVLIVTAGLVTAYGSDITGGIQYGTSQAQVEGYHWLQDYRGNDNVIGSGSTFWIAEAEFGAETANEWSRGRSAQYYYKNREEPFPWLVADSGGSIYAVSGFARARAYQYATGRGETYFIRNLIEFQNNRNRIYDNGNLRLYR